MKEKGERRKAYQNEIPMSGLKPMNYQICMGEELLEINAMIHSQGIYWDNGSTDTTYLNHNLVSCELMNFTNNF